MLEHIYFQDFSYKNKFVIWLYNKDSQTAECSYRVTGGKGSVAPAIINSLLSKEPGIDLSSGIAIIRDMDAFRIQHPFNVVPSVFKTTSSKNLTFYSCSSEPLSLSAPSSSSTSAAASSVPDSLPPPSSGMSREASLTFKTMLAEFPGETLVYDADSESNLRTNNDNNLVRLLKLEVYSQSAVNLTMQVIKNIDYYILRELQIKVAKILFEQELIPAINKYQKGAPIPRFVIDYFAHSVRRIMGNRKYNSIDTAFEACYYEEKEPVPIQSNHEVRRAYAREMLAPLSFLVTDISPPLNTNPELDEWLKKFKEHLNSDEEQIRKKGINKIHTMLSIIEPLIICTGLMDHDYKRLELNTILQHSYLNFNILLAEIEGLHKGATTLHYALQQLKIALLPLKTDWEQQKDALKQQKNDLKQQAPLPEQQAALKTLEATLTKLKDDLTRLNSTLELLPASSLTDTQKIPPILYSIRSIIYSWFQMGLPSEVKAKLKEPKIKSIINETMTEILTNFNHCTQGSSESPAAQYISHTIKVSDTDLYVNPTWKAVLELDFINNTRSLAAHKKDNHKPEKWKNVIIATLSKVLDTQLSTHVRRPIGPASQSSSAPSLLGM